MNERYRVIIRVLRNRAQVYHVFAEDADIAEKLAREHFKLVHHNEHIVSSGAVSFPAAVTLNSVRIIPIGGIINGNLAESRQVRQAETTQES